MHRKVQLSTGPQAVRELIKSTSYQLEANLRLVKSLIDEAGRDFFEKPGGRTGRCSDTELRMRGEKKRLNCTENELRADSLPVFAVLTNSSPGSKWGPDRTSIVTQRFT